MACAAEHCYVLDYALRHASWVPADRFGYQGWQAGGRDLLNHLTIWPDIVADWLWQKHPFAPSVLSYGLARVRRDAAAGELDACVLKLALLSHYLADIVAVSHTWLDILGDETDFRVVGDRMDVKHFHDPVENRVGALLPAWPLDPPRAPVGSFADELGGAVIRAYQIGRGLFDAYFAAVAALAPGPADAITPPMAVLDAWQRHGVANSARAVWALWELAMQPPTDDWPVDPAQIERWTLREVFDWTAAEIRERAPSREMVAELQAAQGWTGAAIFAAPQTCSPAAQAQRALWARQRQAWRDGPMSALLPPRPSEPIPAFWRPVPRP